MKKGVAAGVWFRWRNATTFSAGAFTPPCPLSRRRRPQRGPDWEFAAAGPSPPAFKTNRRCENTASRRMWEEGNKKMKWPEGPETQLGARGAAALNKYWCWCPGICHLAQPTAQLGQRRAGGQGCTAGSEGTQGERGGDLLRGRSSDTLWHPNEGVCSIRAGSSHPRALGWHPAPAPTASQKDEPVGRSTCEVVSRPRH